MKILVSVWHFETSTHQLQSVGEMEILCKLKVGMKGNGKPSINHDISESTAEHRGIPRWTLPITGSFRNTQSCDGFTHILQQE